MEIKSYCLEEAQEILKKNNCQDATIKKRNMENKNRDKDRWISSVRGPFENVFSKNQKRTRYQGVVKTNIQVLLEAIVFNVKRLLVLESPPLFD